MSVKKLFIDCEFNSAGGQLLSMALVGADCDEFYAEIPLSNKEPVNGWVKDNVLPLMEFENPLPLDVFQRELEHFLNQYEAVHVIADWPEDIKYFCEALITGPGERINTPPLTMEIRRDLDAPSKVPHHALWDARGIRDLYLELEKAA
tara:strand:- start:728 stop:1171 length:444 start_codon:yes stop_codon:yes gene_type:complete